MSTGLLEQRANYTATNYEYGYGSGGGADADNDGRKEIDCSHLLFKMVRGAGYQIPYLTTGQLYAASVYYEEIAEDNVQAGDVAVWQSNAHKHTGIVESFTPTTGKGRFYGSQTSTGPASASFGGNGYWPTPDKFLRPKAQYKTGAPTGAPAAAPAPARISGGSYQFPVRKADGSHYALDELYKELEKETSGHYLLGNHGFWHGGIHFSEASVPHAKLKQAVRCMADGEVVAYRLNKDYLTSSFQGPEKVDSLRYSTSFCLIRHTYESAKRPATPLAPPRVDWTDKTVRLESSRNARDIAAKQLGTTGNFEGLMPAGTELKLLRFHDADNVRYALAQTKVALPGRDRAGAPVTCVATAQIWFVAFDNRGAVLKGSNNQVIFKEVPPPAPATPAPAPEAKPESNKLVFYSLYMHLLPFEQYPLKEGEFQKRLRVKVAGRNVRKEANLTGTPLGQIESGAELEVISVTPEYKASPGDTTTYELAQLKILSKSVKKNGAQTAKAGDVIWMALSKKEVDKEPERYTEEIPPQKRVRPTYWRGLVKAKLKKRIPACGTADGAVIGQLAENSVLEYQTDTLKRVQRDGKQLNMAPCTLVSGGFWDSSVTPPNPLWMVIDSESAELTPEDPTEFDTVMTCSIPIKAGDPVGYLGLYETLASTNGGVKSQHQVHVELLSADPNLEKFLKNPAELKSGRQYLRIAQGKPIYSKGGTAAAPVFTPSTTMGENYVIKPNQSQLYKAPDGKEWHPIKVNTATTPVDGFIAKQDAELITQHDWEKLGFQIIKETNSNADGFLDPQAIPEFYQSLYLKIDQLGNKDGTVTPDEIANALKNVKLRDRWSKLIGYHPTEWQAKSSEPKWKPLDDLLKNTPEVLRHEKERIDNLVFWDSIATAIPALANPSVHHLHPLATLDMFMQKGGQLIDVERFLEKYAAQHDSFMTDSPAFSALSKSNLRTIVEQINKFYESDTGKANLFELAYMFATARHEAYYFPTGEFFSSKPEVGNISYFNKYDPVLATTQAHRDRAVGCENTVQGDGYKYRGRGLVHLTWKKNYRKAKEHFGVDFVTQPDKAAEPEHSIPIMIWGMKEGIFTNKKLADYISASGVDYVNARKIINGSDQQDRIAGYARKFEAILRETSSAKETFTP